MYGKLNSEVFDANVFSFRPDDSVRPVVAVDALVSARFAKSLKSFRKVQDGLIAACSPQDVAVR